MKPLFVLLSVFTASLLISKLWKKQWNIPISGRLALSVMLIFTAIGHFVFTDGMAMMIPEVIPLRKEIVLITCIMELLFAVAIHFQKYRRIAGISIIIFLLAVLPANVFAAIEQINYETADQSGPGTEYLFVRIPVQLFYISWTYFFTLKNS